MIPHPPLVISDFRVLCWNIYRTLEGFEPAPEDLVPWIKASWALAANRGPNASDYVDHTVVFTDDSGEVIPYWRKVLDPGYKGGRDPKPAGWLTVNQIGLDYVRAPNSPYHYICRQGYEADDFAGALVQLKRQAQSLPSDDPEVTLVANREIWLNTVDSDWLQLVGDGVTWFNTGPWEPRIRGPQETLEWASRRLKATISSPVQIVDVKMQQGDRSDNLPPGSPRYMIDLINSHPDYHLKNFPEVWEHLWVILTDLKVNTQLDHLTKAQRWLMSRGYPFVL